ncbi:FkbM family methyltransferase [Thermomonas sp. HDW16]|uniref:FkbM family methyltransferase n=1 Tax=Thermomonas sp. HDW16 TaxID=2714945 RepID=UPI0014097749|nr:FkbM family methyltransferase [Thermomonas sp. HDW16]QIL20507.1 FkbM family methyltransferase [Thermomonas sp. HDW16]
MKFQRKTKAFLVRLIGRLQPLLPDSLGHRIELMRQQAVHPLEPELSALTRVLDTFLLDAQLAVDVGANHGLWTVELARRYSQVIAIEPNPYVAVGLRKVVPGNCRVIECGVSRNTGTLRLHVPSVKGRILSGWASFESNNCPDADQILDVEVVVRTLDEILEKVTPSFIKMDVEGHEFEAIAGAKDVLTRARPVLMIEVKSHDEDRLTEALLAIGYVAVDLDRICGIPGTAENRFFVPTEKIALLSRSQRH